MWALMIVGLCRRVLHNPGRFQRVNERRGCALDDPCLCGRRVCALADPCRRGRRPSDERALCGWRRISRGVEERSPRTTGRPTSEPPRDGCLGTTHVVRRGTCSTVRPLPAPVDEPRLGRSYDAPREPRRGDPTEDPGLGVTVGRDGRRDVKLPELPLGCLRPPEPRRMLAWLPLLRPERLCCAGFTKRVRGPPLDELLGVSTGRLPPLRVRDEG
jgi:hypothetical protein